MEEYGEQNTWTENKHKRLLVITVIIGSLVVVAGALSFFIGDMFTNNDKEMVNGNVFPGVGSALKGSLPNMTEDEIKEQMQKEADASRFSFKINSRPVFSSSNGEGNLNIENPNHNVYPFVVQIFLNDNQEKVYDSGGIFPNHHIDTAKLTELVDTGEHAATAYICIYDPETKEYLGKSAVSLTLVIKN